jgi:hypothetical protein
LGFPYSYLHAVSWIRILELRLNLDGSRAVKKTKSYPLKAYLLPLQPKGLIDGALHKSKSHGEELGMHRIMVIFVHKAKETHCGLS